MNHINRSTLWVMGIMGAATLGACGEQPQIALSSEDVVTRIITSDEVRQLDPGSLLTLDTRDPLNQVFYVYDGGNSRIVGFDLEDCYADAALAIACTANLVLGQPDFNSSGCNGDSGFQGFPKRPPTTSG